jgi:hypothetical protein
LITEVSGVSPHERLDLSWGALAAGEPAGYQAGAAVIESWLRDRFDLAGRR